MFSRKLILWLCFWFQISSQFSTSNKNLLSFYATTVEGLEHVLTDEIRQLSGVDLNSIQQGKCGVKYKGNARTGMESIMRLRTSLKVMEKIVEWDEMRFKDDLSDLADSISWTDMIKSFNTVKVETTLGLQVARELAHSHFSSLTVKNSIVDQFRDEKGVRPSVDTENPDLPLLLYLHKDVATLYRLWSGGNSMHKRGYRAGIIHKAALRETTAAALVLASGWDHAGSQVLVDPMCGSGTIAIEAALIAAQTSPGLVRYSSPLLGTAEHLDLEDTAARGARPPCILEWTGIDPQEWAMVYAAASKLDRRRDMKSIVAIANDIHPGAIDLCERSAHNAGVLHLIDFSCSDAKHFRVPRSRAGVMVVTNPPWDKRLEDGVAASWAGLRSFMSDGLDASKEENGDSDSESSSSTSTFTNTSSSIEIEKTSSRLLSRLKQKSTATPAKDTLEPSSISEKLVPVEASSRANGGETQLWVLSGNDDLKVALQPRKHAEALRVNAAGMRVEFLRYAL